MFYGGGPQPSLILTKGFITPCPSLKRFSVPELKEHGDNLSPSEHNISRWGGSQNAKSARWQRTAPLGNQQPSRGVLAECHQRAWAPQASGTAASTRTHLTRGDTLTSTWGMSESEIVTLACPDFLPPSNFHSQVILMKFTYHITPLPKAFPLCLDYQGQIPHLGPQGPVQSDTCLPLQS